MAVSGLCGALVAGTVVVDGTGTRWENTAGLTVGDFGTGGLTVQNAGQVTSGGSVIAPNLTASPNGRSSASTLARTSGSTCLRRR